MQPTPSVPKQRFGRALVSSDRKSPAWRFTKPTRVLVAGGGIAGLSAATVLAERGAEVTVVEREAFLGGRAGSWSDRLADGTPFEMERGFHGFFRQYYNLRALLRRVDPTLSMLRPLDDYPLLGPAGERTSFVDLPRQTPLNLVSLVARAMRRAGPAAPVLALRDMPRIDVKQAAAMLAFDAERTYARYDAIDARSYLDALRFPTRARRMLFDVFAHSFFNPEEQYSAGELLMMFHLYFLGNPEGLVFDVAKEPFGRAFWEPLRRYLEWLGVRFVMRTSLDSIEREGDHFRSTTSDGATHTTDAVVLAVTVPALQGILGRSSIDASTLRDRVATLDVTSPFVVWRLFVDRPAHADRAPFVGTTGLGILDNVSLFERFEGESERWAARHRGSVVELHAYAVPPEMPEAAIRTELMAGLHAIYPELRSARVIEERYLHRRDCPSFGPGSHATRPGVHTEVDGLVLAGDFVKLPFPTALMERAASSGMMAANVLLERASVLEEPLWSVPTQGLFAPFSSS